MKLLVTGSLAFDRIAVFPDRFANHILPDKTHQLNVVFAVEKMNLYFGGTGGNIAYNLTLLGEKPILLATAGKDFEVYEKWLMAQGIDLTHIKKIPELLTASATITTDLDDNQITAFDSGAMSLAHQAKIEDLSESVKLAIIAPNGVQAMVQYAETLKEMAVDYIADPGQAITALEPPALKTLIDGAKILIANDYEWELIKKKTGWDESSVLEHSESLIVTLGEKGSILKELSGVTEIPSYKADKVVDPTGAGDAYRAGLMYGLKRQFSLVKSARIGAWLAVKAVGAEGTQNHLINQNKFHQFIESI